MRRLGSSVPSSRSFARLNFSHPRIHDVVDFLLAEAAKEFPYTPDAASFLPLWRAVKRFLMECAANFSLRTVRDHYGFDLAPNGVHKIRPRALQHRKTPAAFERSLFGSSGWSALNRAVVGQPRDDGIHGVVSR